MFSKVRRATLEDIDRVLPLVKGFVTSFEVVESRFRESFASILENPDAIVLVAEDADSLVGYSLGFCHDTFYANGKVAWLEEIMVAPSHRLRGVGESMMNTFEQWAKDEGAILAALATRRASSFYEALNYQESAAYFRKPL